ncbi:ABC transporter substrate-binding protein [Arthrobacter sp. GCM10027362]|uniref:ABC transporter substrate-binding protein n=1 Tax=Arthrobacter sp. GCM10027362 TaxID=3273379 RepID=UPI00362A8A88
MTSRRLRTAAAATAAATLLLTAGCSAGSSSGSENAATGEPIVVSALSGLSFFPEASKAAQAVFEDYNAAGGLNGRPVQFNVIDDKTDPGTAATAAKEALGAGAIAMVGSASLVDCAVNHRAYEDAGIVSIPAVGSAPECFTTPNFSPVNAGPFLDSFMSLSYGSEDLKFNKICAVITTEPASAKPAVMQSIDAWKKATGKDLAYLDDSLTRGQSSYAANISKLRSQDCDAVFINDVADAVVGFLGEAANQGMNLPVLATTAVYSDQFAATANYQGDIYVPAEFAPYGGSDDASADWSKVMDEHKVEKTSFAQGGYLAAKYFINILESIKGEPTREAFTKAAESMKQSVNEPMAQDEWIFGKADAHHPNETVYPVKLAAGQTAWTPLGPVLDGGKRGWVATKAVKN